MQEDVVPKGDDEKHIVELTSHVISAYVSNNAVAPADLPNLIGDVFNAFQSISNASEATEKFNQKPAVNPKKSVFEDYIICLEDGKHFKSLKRHLRSHFNLSPEEYRKKWGLAADYPMVAPSYSIRRSKLAQEKGLGRGKNKF